MVLIQANIPKKIHKKLQLYKIRNDIPTLQQAIVEIVKEKVEKENGDN